MKFSGFCNLYVYNEVYRQVFEENIDLNIKKEVLLFNDMCDDLFSNGNSISGLKEEFKEKSSCLLFVFEYEMFKGQKYELNDGFLLNSVSGMENVFLFIWQYYG